MRAMINHSIDSVKESDDESDDESVDENRVWMMVVIEDIFCKARTMEIGLV